MLKTIKQYCPECGSDRIEKERVEGIMDAFDKICLKCKKTFAPSELLPDPALQTCKACKTFIPVNQSYRFQGKGKDHLGDLKKGRITCPDCKAVHHAVGSETFQNSGLRAGSAYFGELLKKK